MGRLLFGVVVVKDGGGGVCDCLLAWLKCISQAFKIYYNWFACLDAEARRQCDMQRESEGAEEKTLITVADQGKQDK